MSWFKSLLGRSPPPPEPTIVGPLRHPTAPPAWPPPGGAPASTVAPPAWTPPGAAPPPAAPREIACSVCGTPRRDANKLVAGPGDVAICDACVAACADVLEHGDNGQSVKCAMNLVVRELAGLARPIDHAASRKLVSAALVLAAGDAAACRQIAATAVHVGDNASAALAFGSVNEKERVTTDRVNEAISYEAAGAFKTALALLEAIEPATFTAEHRVIVPLHRASVRLAAGVVERAEAEALAALVDDVEAKLPGLSLSDAYQRDLGREILLCRARVARLRGDHERAIAALRAHLQSAPQDQVSWALLYELHADRGQIDDALSAKTKALSLTHPEGSLAASLRARTP